jgi:hypothetical protein
MCPEQNGAGTCGAAAGGDEPRPRRSEIGGNARVYPRARWALQVDRADVMVMRCHSIYIIGGVGLTYQVIVATLPVQDPHPIANVNPKTP